MFTTRLISGIILVLLSVVIVGQGGVLLFGVTALISLAGLFELYRVLGIHKRFLAIVGYATAVSYYGILWCDDANGPLCFYISGIQDRGNNRRLFWRMLCACDAFVSVSDKSHE